MAKYPKAILKETLTIKITDGYKISKTISEWLNNINKKQSVIKSKNGLTLDSHKLYLDLVEKQIPICNLVEEKYAKNAISNAIMFYLEQINDPKEELTNEISSAGSVVGSPVETDKNKEETDDGLIDEVYDYLLKQGFIK
jgi:hypothetical protein